MLIVDHMKLTIPPDTLRQKLYESLHYTAPALTHRDIVLPQVRGKVMAVIGVRRGGKTSFMRDHALMEIKQGRPSESQLLLSLEDERLFGMTVADLAWLVEEHGRQFPALLGAGARTIYFDEVHLVPGWETYVRRLMDEGTRQLFVSGSSARLLSREVATSLRGRGLEVLVHPFSFREALRHAALEPTKAWSQLRPAERTALDAALARYLETGGFPEAQNVPARDRLWLVKSYVDSMLLRDVIERYRVSNPIALNWLQHAVLSAPGGRFTITKFRDSLRSQGVAVAKETLEAYLAHLDDAFLLRTVSMHATSERQRMVNPRKAYPVDPGLIALYARSGRTYRGASLETVILLELERRGYQATWVKVDDGRDAWEVDFFAEQVGEQPLLLQVCLDADADPTWEREVRALAAAAVRFPEAKPILITANSTPPRRALPAPLRWQSAPAWLLSN
jgi:predicted AAA+ superfamily ATPase